MFAKELRSKMLAVFYFATPVGSGLGYIVGRELANVFANWHWSLRGTPILGAIAVILILFVLREPQRGEADGQHQLKATNYQKDLMALASNRSFLFSTVGFSCISFFTGALAWWGPKFIQNAIYSLEVPVADRPIPSDKASMVFGTVTLLAGILGVPLGEDLFFLSLSSSLFDPSSLQS